MFEFSAITESQTRPAAKCIRFVLGLLFITVASLKIYGLGLGVSAIPSVGWYAAPIVQSAVIVWELLLGYWLVTGNSSTFSWIAALITFCTFAFVSGSLGTNGVAECGCFGAIKASPWHAFIVDLAGILALLLAKPRISEFTSIAFRTQLLKCAAYSAVLVCVMSLLGLICSTRYGSISGAIATLRGDHLSFPGNIDFGSGTSGERLNREFQVTNQSPFPIRLLGGTSDCSCIATTSLPVTIPPRSSANIQVQLNLPRSGIGQITRTFELWTDSQINPKLTLLLNCHIRSDSK